LLENNRTRIALLEEAARLLYREWFVQLRYPGHEHDVVVDGLPSGWRRQPIIELANIVRGKSYTSAELVESGGQPFVNLKCINRFGGFRLSGLKRFKGEHKPQHLLAPGDIVIGVTDMTREAMVVAQAARVPKTVGETAIFSMDLVKVVPALGVEPEWLYSLLRFSSFSAEIREKATGATVLHLQPRHIESWSTPVPSGSLRSVYAEQARELLAQIDNLEIQIERLAEARALLLPPLMNGDIAV
jgi:type I restriction enzyme, S subunit